MISTLTYLVVVTLARAVYTYGYLEYVLPIVENFLIDIFFPELRAEGIVAGPLYERSNVSPIQAYAWALAVALATALITIDLFRRKIKYWYLALYALAILHLFIGYASLAIFKLPPTQISRGTYVVIPFIIPIAAMALTKTLKANRRIALASLILVIMAVPIASHDPMISPREWLRIRKFDVVQLSSADLTEASNLMPLLQHANNIYIKSEAFRIGGGERLKEWEPIFTNKLTEALKTLLYIHALEGPEISIVLDESSYIEFNRAYDSGRSAVYCSLYP
jgi:hypothetical protein